jgi:hypothetical protein
MPPDRGEATIQIRLTVVARAAAHRERGRGNEEDHGGRQRNRIPVSETNAEDVVEQLHEVTLQNAPSHNIFQFPLDNPFLGIRCELCCAILDVIQVEFALRQRQIQNKSRKRIRALNLCNHIRDPPVGVTRRTTTAQSEQTFAPTRKIDMWIPQSKKLLADGSGALRMAIIPFKN